MDIKIHLISDFNMGLCQLNDPADLELPDVDLVIINGNMGHFKRGWMYAETLCKKYPDTIFVYNFGFIEQYYLCYSKHADESYNLAKVRVKQNQLTPKNLRFSTEPQVLTLRNGAVVDLLTTFGFCKVSQVKVPWEDTIWFKKCVAGMNYASEGWDEIDSDKVSHFQVPVWATVEWLNEKYEQEQKLVKDWEVNHIVAKKILVTHVNPIQDPLYVNMDVNPYLIHLHEGLWLSAGPKMSVSNFLGAKFVSNPGSGFDARQNVITITA